LASSYAQKKSITITVDSPSPTDAKTPGRFSKSISKKKHGNNEKVVLEKNGKLVTTPKLGLRLTPPPGFSKSDLIGNDTVFRANSFPSFLNNNVRIECGTLPPPLGNETPRKTASYPLISYADIFSQPLPVPLDPHPNLENYGGESKFVSLFSQPVSSELCGEINLKSYISLDFIDKIEDPPQLQSPKTPNLKPPSPNPHETNDKSPSLKSSKTPQKSPRNRPVSPLDDQRLVQRQKQIDYGYRTVGYLRYRLLVPKEGRKPDHPRTPKKAQACSKRSWDGQLKKWRRDLHLWDPNNLEAFRSLLNSEVVENFVMAHPELEDVVRSVREKLDNPNLKNSEEDEEDYIPSFTVNSGENNQVIAEPNKHKVARTLIF